VRQLAVSEKKSVKQKCNNVNISGILQRDVECFLFLFCSENLSFYISKYLPHLENTEKLDDTSYPTLI
jgi:hypothetical protein